MIMISLRGQGGQVNARTAGTPWLICSTLFQRWFVFWSATPLNG